MVIEIVKTLINRDLNKLVSEMEQYSHEGDIWKIDGQILNSAGNLCLHLVGNLNTYIGKELGGTGYVRNRPLEFSKRDVPRQELLQMIEGTKQMVNQTLDNVDETRLLEEYPVLVFDKATSVGYMLIHIATHLSYHLGQINYHRRLLGKG